MNILHGHFACKLIDYHSPEREIFINISVYCLYNVTKRLRPVHSDRTLKVVYKCCPRRGFFYAVTGYAHTMTT